MPKPKLLPEAGSAEGTWFVRTNPGYPLPAGSGAALPQHRNPPHISLLGARGTTCFFEGDNFPRDRDTCQATLGEWLGDVNPSF